MSAAGANFNNICLDISGGTSAASTYIGSSDVNGNESPRAAVIIANDNGLYGGGNNNKCSMIGQSSNEGYLTISGLVLKGASLWCLTIGDTAGTNSSPSGIVIQNCEITGNSAQNCAVASGQNCCPFQICSATGCVIQNNYIHDNFGWTDNEHFSAIYHWGLGSGTSGTRILNNTLVNSGGLHGKEGNQWGTEIAYNYIDMSQMTPGGNGGNTAAIIGFNADGGNGASNGSLTSVHHNILISYVGSAAISPSILGGLWMDLGYTNGQEYWDYPLEIYNNTCVASSAINGCGALAFEKVAGSHLVSAWNNLFWDGGLDAVNQYGWWFTNADAFSLCDYNLYGSHQGAQWASFAANGTQNQVSSIAVSFSAWRAAIGGLDAHSSIFSSNPFTDSGQFGRNYIVESGSPAFQAGRIGGVTGGAACNVGAWDGIVEEIGCNFAAPGPIPNAPQLTIS
jgi:hypothetical protein